jgi:hypothetical protein
MSRSSLVFGFKRYGAICRHNSDDCINDQNGNHVVVLRLSAMRSPAGSSVRRAFAQPLRRRRHCFGFGRRHDLRPSIGRSSRGFALPPPAPGVHARVFQTAPSFAGAMAALVPRHRPDGPAVRRRWPRRAAGSTVASRPSGSSIFWPCSCTQSTDRRVHIFPRRCIVGDGAGCSVVPQCVFSIALFLVCDGTLDVGKNVRWISLDRFA